MPALPPEIKISTGGFFILDRRFIIKGVDLMKGWRMERIKPLVKIFILSLIFTSFTLVEESTAAGTEFSIGYLRQEPSGSIEFKGDSLDIKNDLGFDSKNKPFGRLKIDMPLFIPNIYIIATPTRFEGTGSKSINFQFGDVTFSQNVPFHSKLKLDHYDITLFYSLPFIKTATMGKLNMELGVNARVIDFKAEADQESLNLSESESFVFAIPMVYVGGELRPIELISLEIEGRGINYSSNHYYDVFGKIKIHTFGPAFLSVGYRYEDIKLDHNDVKASYDSKGPFAEIGFEF